MRMLALVGMLFAVVGCGPATRFDGQRGQDAGAPSTARLLKLRVENKYAESIFTVRLSPASDAGASAGAALLQDERIAANRTKEAQFGASTGDVLALEARVTSLGSPSTFTGNTRPVPADKSTLVLSYDYDLALAEFRLVFGWEL